MTYKSFKYQGKMIPLLINNLCLRGAIIPSTGHVQLHRAHARNSVCSPLRSTISPFCN
ncbi:hypothetical protein M426DRAFT_255200 [Hypoxylon sp. CI-4A]|nr:hypothetical protein M426DRAFT_255200 [Hypoxylon sp. CI-4A]